MRKGILLLPCLLLVDAAPLSAQYSYPVAAPGYSYGYAPPAVPPGYAVPAYPYTYPSPYAYPRYGYPGNYGYPVYNGAPPQAWPARPPAAPGYPYVYGIRPVQATAPRPTSLPPALPGASQAPPAAAPAPATGDHKAYGGYPYDAVPVAPAPAIVGSTAAPPAAAVGPDASGHAPVVVDEADGHLFPQQAAPCLPKGCTCKESFWVRGEYLLWQVRDEPLPGPLVTTGNPTQATQAGVPGVPGTLVLYGGAPIDFGMMSGGRLTVGGWVNATRTLGLEVSGFGLMQGSSNFALASNPTGNPPIYIPTITATTLPGIATAGTGTRVTVADPTQDFAGSVAVHLTTQLYGGEANGLFNMIYTPSFRMDGLLGFRYLDLNENFDLSDNVKDLIFLNVTTLHDTFQTQNQFFGGQAGLRMRLTCGHILAEVTGKVAAGTTQEMLNINGSGLQTGPSSPLGSFNGGIFAEPTNIGRYHHNQFTLVPQVQGRLAWLITSHLNVFAGYDFLYWNQTARVGNQIDRVVNFTQNPLILGAPTTLTGPPRPLPNITSSAFFAEGVSFGMEVRY